MKRILVLLVVVVLALPASLTMAKSEPECEITTIQVYGLNSPFDTFDGYLNDYLMEKIGVRVELIFSDVGKIQAMFASGDLPDVGFYSVNGTLDQAIRANLLTDLEPYLDKLPHFTENFAPAIEYSRNVLSGGKGIYGLPTNSGYVDINKTFPIDAGNSTYWIKWDVYEKIGAPEVKTMDDIIPVLKKMMEAQSTVEDGSKTWGIGLALGWGEGAEFQTPIVNIFATTGYDGYMFGVKELNTVENKLGCDALDEDSVFMKGIRFYYDCNQAGILDPDSIYQYLNSANAKINNGQYMTVGFGEWQGVYNDAHDHGEKASAYQPLLAPWVVSSCNSATGFQYGQQPYSVSATTEHLDACLKYLDIMYSYEDVRQMLYGPEGLFFTKGENGHCFTTPANDERLKTGVALDSEGNEMQLASFAFGMDWKSIDPANGEPIEMSKWPSEVAKIKANSPTLKSWCNHYGFEGPLEGFIAQNGRGYIPSPRALYFKPAMDEDTELVNNAVIAELRTGAWRMIFAKEEAEYNAIHDEMVNNAKGLGYDIMLKWSDKAWAAANAELAKYDAAIG